jgi:histidinol phosphatase-like PHP family hydrolase
MVDECQIFLRLLRFVRKFGTAFAIASRTYGQQRLAPNIVKAYLCKDSLQL